MSASTENIKFLFKNFLQKRTIYGQTESYWKRSILPILKDEGIQPQDWLSSEFANGQKFYDGNPIYNAKILEKKAIRIIQEEPESTSLQISAWIDDTEDKNGNKLDELVISLELTRESKKIALDLIQSWISPSMDTTNMSAFIDKKIQ